MAPAFSPSAKKLLYLSNQQHDSYQIYVQELDAVGLPRRVTDEEDSITFALFSPTSEDIIIYGKSVGGDENQQFYELDLRDGSTVNLTNEPSVRHNFGGISRDGQYILYSSNKRNGTDFDTYRLERETGEVIHIFDANGWSYGEGFSPGGRYCIVGVARGIGDNDLYLMDLEKELRPFHLTPHDGEAHFENIAWFEDEGGFLAITNQDSDFLRVQKYTIENDTWEVVLQKPWDIEALSKTRQEDQLIVNVNEDGYPKLYSYDFRDQTLGQEHSLAAAATDILGSVWSWDGQKLAYTAGITALHTMCSYGIRIRMCIPP